MFLMVRSPGKTVGPVSDKIGCISGIKLGLEWKLRTHDKPFGFLVFKPGVRFAEDSFRNYFVNWVVQP